MSTSGYVRRAIAAQSSKYSARSSLASIARERLTILRSDRESRSTERLPLVRFVGAISRDLSEPHHLTPYAAELEQACSSRGEVGNRRTVVAAPPQHGKTVLTLRALLWWDRYFPGKRHAYVTYNDDRTKDVARDFWILAQQAGFDPKGTLAKVRLRGGSTIVFTSIGGKLTGDPIDGVCIVDDPIKGPEQAASPTIRANTVKWFDAVAFTRRHQGTSFIVMATRWHPDDLSGVLHRERGWPYINLKAIAEGETNSDGRVLDDPLGRHVGEALWPAEKPPEFFEAEQKNLFWWSALYQGEPRPAGGTVFQEPARYSELPRTAYRVGFGVDLGFAAKSTADFSVLIEIWRVDTSDPKKPLFYIADVIRRQVAATNFTLTLKAKYTERRARMRWYASGPELGAADFIRKQGIDLETLPPRGKKLVRAQPVAAAWNEGRVLVPETDVISAEWLPTLLDEVLNFTGSEASGTHDDQVDALAAGFDLLNAGAVDLNRLSKLWDGGPQRRM